jgi:hypothetical protein
MLGALPAYRLAPHSTFVLRHSSSPPAGRGLDAGLSRRRPARNGMDCRPRLRFPRTPVLHRPPPSAWPLHPPIIAHPAPSVNNKYIYQKRPDSGWPVPSPPTGEGGLRKTRWDRHLCLSCWCVVPLQRSPRFSASSKSLRFSAFSQNHCGPGCALLVGEVGCRHLHQSGGCRKPAMNRVSASSTACVLAGGFFF